MRKFWLMFVLWGFLNICKTASLIIEGVVYTNQIHIVVISFLIELSTLFFIEKTILNKVSNSPKVMAKKYQLYEFFAGLTDLKEFENFCIEKNNKDIVDWVFLSLNSISYEKAQLLVATKNLDEIKSNLPHTRNRKQLFKQISSEIYWYNFPIHFSEFLSYKSSQMLSKPTSTSEPILACFSIILSLLSLVGLTSFSNLHWYVYLWFYTPVVIYIISSIFYYKEYENDVIKFQEDTLIEIQNNYSEFQLGREK